MNSSTEFHDDEIIVSSEVVYQRITLLIQVLAQYKKSIELFKEYKVLVVSYSTEENELLCSSMRDAMIQRFSRCIYLFWKTLIMYLQNIELVSISGPSPRGLVREVVHARIITDHEGLELMKMIDVRDNISRMYQKAIADDIAHEVPKYYELMKEITDRIQLIIEKNKRE